MKPAGRDHPPPSEELTAPGRVHLPPLEELRFSARFEIPLEKCPSHLKELGPLGEVGGLWKNWGFYCRDHPNLEELGASGRVEGLWESLSLSLKDISLVYMPSSTGRVGALWESLSSSSRKVRPSGRVCPPPLEELRPPGRTEIPLEKIPW